MAVFFPDFSPYQYAHNNLINRVDHCGLYDDEPDYDNMTDEEVRDWSSSGGEAEVFGEDLSGGGGGDPDEDWGDMEADFDEHEIDGVEQEQENEVIDRLERIVGGISVVNGLVGFDAAINSTHVINYAQKVNGKVVNSIQLTINHQNKALSLLNKSKALGKKLGAVGGIVILADVAINSELSASNAVNGFMTAISFTGIGGVVAGAWFIADIGTGLVTGTSLSTRLDNAVGEPLVDW